MKPASIILIVSCLTVAATDALAQNEADTSSLREVYDPGQNRLFAMSTGRTMPEGKVSIGDFMLFLLQAGYAPADFIHFNLSYLTTFTRSSARYWSVGTKVQILKTNGVVKGIAIGADFGFFDELFGVASRYDERVVSFNIAASVGGTFGGVHLNMAYLASPASGYGRAPFPTYIQIGTDMILSRYESGGGLKLMGEILTTPGNRGISGNVAIVGIRVCSPKSVFDIGWPFALGEGRAVASQVPFLSFCFVF
ncbi:MAG: hypothetical protein KF749_00270 [Bacteroidetes bacterium]|nr:hypothetical protein [Bacteroidota bacterium]MCW5895063.1 hypothetical protein [Bacteroidota bacterium]